MKSTMQSTPLLISSLLRFGTTMHGDSEVVTWTANGARRTTYRELGRQAAQLAHGLRGLGITGDQRVGTFMWNNAEHLMAYLAVPVDGGGAARPQHPSLPRAARLRDPARRQRGRHRRQHAGRAVRPAPAPPPGGQARHRQRRRRRSDDAALAQHVEAVHDLATLIEGQPTSFDWPEDLSEDDASSMCYTSGTTGHPKGVVYSHRSNYLHAMGVCLDASGITQADRLLIVVPLFHANAWGYPYSAMVTGSTLVMPDRFLQAEPLAP